MQRTWTDVRTLKLGRNPSDPEKLANSIKLRNILRPRLEVIPATDNNFTDYLPGATWPMGLNNKIGDCVSVGTAHSQRLYRKALTGTDLEWTDDQILAFYRTQNPGNQDNGMDIQTAMSELLHNGGPDGIQIVAYASVDPTNVDEVRAALHIFGCLLTGFMVQSHNMDEFDRGVPWTWQKNDYDIGGHCTILGDYGATLTDAFGAITWQEFYLMTQGFWAKQMQELWVPIWPWLIGSARFAANIDSQALADEFSQVTHGGVLPVPVTPPPAPDPTPTPDPIPDPTPTPDPGGCSQLIPYLDRIAKALEKLAGKKK